MTKRQRREFEGEEEAERRGECCGASRKPKRSMLEPTQRQRHLYLVLDDWEKGYSVYRVVGDDDEVASVDAGHATAEPAPVVRIEAPHSSAPSFAAHGAKIFALRPSASSPGIPVFDTDTLGVTTCPFPRSRTALGKRSLVCASVVGGDRLLAFVASCLELLGPQPPPLTDESWSWTSAEAPPPPFESSVVSGYAVHPDGRTVFMSAKNWSPIHNYAILKRNSTFAFDAERLEWTRLGEWLLPFKGRAHYDRGLDAWVGACLYPEGAGRLCCCDVVPVPPPAATTMPAWKLGVDVLFDASSVEHEGATLVYMGDGRFCVVECRLPEEEEYDSNPRGRVLTMTSCVVKYNKDGDLVTHRCRAYAPSISYQTARRYFNVEQIDPIAFWM